MLKGLKTTLKVRDIGSRIKKSRTREGMDGRNSDDSVPFPWPFLSFFNPWHWLWMVAGGMVAGGMVDGGWWMVVVTTVRRR